MRLLLSALFSLSLVACAGEIYSTVPPPAPQTEVVGPAPYGDAVYINGYWGWEGGRHIWHGGHYVHGRPGYVYEPHRWEPRGGRYVQVPGRWRRR